MLRLGVVALVVGLTLTACGGDPGGDTTTTAVPGTSATTTTAPASSSPGLSDFDDSLLDGTTAELAAIREANDHALPLDAALDLFASVYGAIPGGDPTRFEPRHDDGSLAIRALGRHWEALTEEQRNGALARLGYAPIQYWRGPAAGPEVTALQAQVDAMRAQIAVHVGQDVPFPIVAVAAPGLTHEVTGVPIGGDATPERNGTFAYFGSPDACRIRFNTEHEISSYLVAHEVFHCFQFHLVGDLALIGDDDWIVEGSAVWVGAALASDDGNPAVNFEDWSDHLGSLFSLDYPAVGFFWVIESMGANVWTAVGPMLQAGGGEASVAATGLDPEDVLLRVATSIARRAIAPALDVSDRWDFSVPVPESMARFSTTLSRDAPIERTLLMAPFSRTHPGVIEALDGAILEVTATSGLGVLEFFGSPDRLWQGSFHEHFCLEAGQCQCGGDEGDALEMVGREFVVGFGQRSGGTVVFSFRVLDPEDAFVDGRWEGTITATSLTVAPPEVEVTRHEFTTPFEVVIVDGQVVDGSFSIVAFADGAVPTGAISAVATIPGTFTGCGWAPQLLPAYAHLDLTMETAEGPFSFELELPMEGPQFATVWIFDEGNPPHRRTGTIDVGEALAFMAATGVNPSTMSVTFEATRVGDP
jgi:hypothetical protein